jgi:hypothetical protein
MRTAFLAAFIAFTGCATDFSGTGKIVSDSICSWELHGGAVTPESNAMYCWAERHYLRDKEYIHIAMPVDCETVLACSL